MSQVIDLFAATLVMFSIHTDGTVDRFVIKDMSSARVCEMQVEKMNRENDDLGILFECEWS